MKPLFRTLALIVALATTGLAVVFTQSQSQRYRLACPTSPARLRAGGACPPTRTCVPEMNVKGAERLMTARGKALIAAFDELAAPKYDCSPARHADHLRRPVGGADRAARRSRDLHLRKRRCGADRVAGGTRTSEAPIGAAVHARLLHRTIRRESARCRDQSVHVRSRGVRRRRDQRALVHAEEVGRALFPERRHAAAGPASPRTRCSCSARSPTPWTTRRPTSRSRCPGAAIRHQRSAICTWSSPSTRRIRRSIGETHNESLAHSPARSSSALPSRCRPTTGRRVSSTRVASSN